jgi:hypothetical protein
VRAERAEVLLEQQGETSEDDEEGQEEGQDGQEEGQDGQKDGQKGKKKSLIVTLKIPKGHTGP